MTDSSDIHPYDRHVGRYGKQLAAGLIDQMEQPPPITKGNTSVSW